MNKIALIIMFLCTLSPSLQAMKRPSIDTLEKRKRAKKNIHKNLHPSLPTEIQDQIFTGFLAHTAKRYDPVKMCLYIHHLSLVNKKWNERINDSSTIRAIINTIYNNAYSIKTSDQYWIAKKIATSATKTYATQSMLLSQKIRCNGVIPISIDDLIKKGADVNYRDINYNNGRESLLLIAVKNRNFTFTKILLEHGADPDISDFNETPLDYAIAEKDATFIELLLQYNPTKKGLIMALKTNNVSLVELLLTKKKLSENELNSAYMHTCYEDTPNESMETFLAYYFAD